MPVRTLPNIILSVKMLMQLNGLKEIPLEPQG